MKKFNRVVAVMMFLAVIVGCFSGFSTAADKYDEYPIAENTSLRGKIVFIDAGHGKGNYNGEGSYYEHEGNLTLALLVKENLERCGATVIMTRPDETDVDSYARMALVNIVALQEIQKEYIKDRDNSDDEARIAELQASIDEITELIADMQSVIDDPALSPKYFNSPWNINTKITSELKKIFKYEEHEVVGEKMLFLSIHANALDNSSVNGTITYYLTNDFYDNLKYYTDLAYVEHSHTFAQLIQDNVVEAGSFKDRGLAVNNFFMIRELNIPAALLEVAFYTNSSDRAKLQNPIYQKRISAGITYAVQDYFEIYGSKEVILGDVNYDGIVSNADVVYVARYIVDLETEIDLMTADFDGDGVITNSDLVALAKKIVE